VEPERDRLGVVVEVDEPLLVALDDVRDRVLQFRLAPVRSRRERPLEVVGAVVLRIEFRITDDLR
jgi:hypothetical protein